MRSKPHMTIEPSAFSVRQFCQATSLGRTTFYELLRKGEIKAIRVGGRRLIPATEIQRLLTEKGGCDAS